MPLLVPTTSRFVLLVVGDGDDLATRLEAAPIRTELLRCPTPESAACALDAGRRYSAVVLPVRAPAHPIDPLLAAAAERAVVPILTANPLSPPTALATAVAAGAAPVRRGDQPPDLGPARWAPPPTAGEQHGRLVAVCGPGGTGTSVVAAALSAQVAIGRRVLLADLALRADQAFLHGLGEAVRGLFDLVETARYRPIGATDVRRHTVALGHCRLLPGLRRASHWTAVSPPAFDSTLMTLLAPPTLVIADVTGDVEGERDSGSLDVEERNHLARRTLGTADVVVLVGGPGANGARRMALLIDDLLDHGVDPARIQPVVNRAQVAPMSAPRLCGLPAEPLCLANCVGFEGGLLPPATVSDLARAVTDLLSRLPAADRSTAPVPVAPGSLGSLGCRNP